jgi:hypothetical protein
MVSPATRDQQCSTLLMMWLLQLLHEQQPVGAHTGQLTTTLDQFLHRHLLSLASSSLNHSLHLLPAPRPLAGPSPADPPL